MCGGEQEPRLGCRQVDGDVPTELMREAGDFLREKSRSREKRPEHMQIVDA